MTIIFLQTMTRRRAPVVSDPLGNETRNWSAASDTALEGVSVQPNSQDEEGAAVRSGVVTGWRVQSRPGVDLDVLPSDRIVHDGIVCEVVGEVARWPDPLTGAVHHVEFTIRRWEG